MAKTLEDDLTIEELKELISLFESSDSNCTNCGSGLVQHQNTKWGELTTTLKMVCPNCGHSTKTDTKYLS